jgi:hypothetical protein
MAEERAQRRLAAVLAADAIRWAQRLITMNTSSYGRVFVWTVFRSDVLGYRVNRIGYGGI